VCRLAEGRRERRVRFVGVTEDGKGGCDLVLSTGRRVISKQAER
jgi:hypothetical protein